MEDGLGIDALQGPPDGLTQRVSATDAGRSAACQIGVADDDGGVGLSAQGHDHLAEAARWNVERLASGGCRRRKAAGKRQPCEGGPSAPHRLAVS